MLPKISHPIFEFNIPSTNKLEKNRQFLVKEEKILLMAKCSEEPSDILRAIKQVVNNCSLSESFDIDKLAMFDLEYLFLQLRSVSVENIVKVSYRDNDDQKVYDFQIDIKNVDVQFPENVDKIIKVTDDIGIKMKYPPASLFDDKDYFNSGDQAYYELILRCIDTVYSGDDLFNATDYTKEDLEVFLDDCGIKTFENIRNFMNNIPKLYYKIEYTNANGKLRTIELTSLSDFFTLR